MSGSGLSSEESIHSNIGNESVAVPQLGYHQASIFEYSPGHARMRIRRALVGYVNSPFIMKLLSAHGGHRVYEMHLSGISGLVRISKLWSPCVPCPYDVRTHVFDSISSLNYLNRVIVFMTPRKYLLYFQDMIDSSRYC